MSWSYGWRPYVSVAQRRANAARAAAKLTKGGRVLRPIQIGDRGIASTFWGKAWCQNLESYGDYANRLPRGRNYVRNGSVLDLQIAEGRVTALVSGSSLYNIEIQIKPCPTKLWKTIRTECAGKIDSLIELLQGRLSSSVMEIVTRPENGLFPKPSEIKMTCSCPDWAGLCKHLAASLYGVGALLDQNPELLFQLRGLDPAELIGDASASEAVRQRDSDSAQSALREEDLAGVFGIELDTAKAPGAPKPKPPARKAASRERVRVEPKPERAGASKPRTKAVVKPKKISRAKPAGKAKAVGEAKPERKGVPSARGRL